MERIFGYVLSGLGLVVGVGVEDGMYVGEVMGMKLGRKEFVGMVELKKNVKWVGG